MNERLLGGTIACVGLLIALGAAPAWAHEYWLAPLRYAAAQGDTIAIGAHVGTGFRGEPVPYAATRSLRFEIQSARRIDLSRAPLNGDLTWARLVAADPGGALIGYESNFAKIELDGPAFDAYLATEGLDGPRAERARRKERGVGRERYARCPKTWIAGADTKRALEPLGLTLEVVPLEAPGESAKLPLRVLYRGHPLAGALVRAWRQPLGPSSTPSLAPLDAAARDSVGPSSSARTASDGTVTLATPTPGEWLVSVVHMVRSSEPDIADWQSYWASLTFARGGK